MKSKILLSTILLSVIILSSCTIQKRIYQKGYHIEWKADNSSAKNKDKSLAENKIKHNKIKRHKEEMPVYYMKSLNNKLDTLPSDLASKSNIKINTKKIKAQKLNEKVINKINKYSKTTNLSKSYFNNVTGLKDPINKKYSIIGLILGTAACALFIITTISLFIVSGIEILSVFFTLVIFYLLFMILSTIFSSIGIAKAIKYPEKFGGKTMAIIGLLLALLSLIILLLLILLI